MPTQEMSPELRALKELGKFLLKHKDQIRRNYELNILRPIKPVRPLKSWEV